MIYRTLGRTGYKVSQLGFGAMRLPMVGEGEARTINRDLAIPMIHRAFQAGVNYIDTAIGYCNKDSQRVVGEALKGWREKVVLSTKNHYYGDNEKDWWQNLEDSLSRLQVDSIDLYNHHGIRWARYQEFVLPFMSKWMRKAKDQGLIKHICCSFHDDNAALLKVLDEDYFDSITLQYNMLDRQLADGIAYAHSKNVGVVVMGPVAGGRLGVDNETLGGLIPGIKRVPELALRFVLANPNVSIALSGMSTMQQVEENIAIANGAQALSEADKAAIEDQLNRMAALAGLYCTGCGYCLPCSKGINIANIFKLYNQGRVYGLWENSRKNYAAITSRKKVNKVGAPADDCVECKTCEQKCPQNLPIRKQLKEAHQALSGTPATQEKSKIV